MSKNSNDYVHFYLGCKAYWQCEGVKSTYAAPINYTMLDSADWIKPILRPLSTMTDEEKVEVCEIANLMTAEHFIDAVLDGRPYNLRWNTCSELFRYLLSRGFDLFGLINEGLAFDATELEL